ncbi:hypothetical protein FMEXI_3133 [Fusarium mexicanum]|uniref:Uncharacterized protein n=1 Tax=Fusarium mexicanum TaxID=751941 RepID=A0A8H5JAJ3_9HYPO|nr:hypothetical protein FMEXI_3133 [Fusarium mexicanum]
MFALVWLYLLGACLAQGSSPPEDCSSSDFTDNVDKRAISFNASGTLPIEFKGAKNPWYISTAVTDERDQNRTFDGAHSRQWIKGFISVPRYLVADKSVGVCSFMFQGLNISSENPDDADKSCEGVISDACIKELENSTLPIRTSGGCPSSAAFILSAQCKKQLTLYQLVSPRNISTDSCTLGNIPNLDVPVDYWTYGGSISSGETGGDDYDDFDSYDMRVQQTIPVFTVVSGGGISDRKLVCIAPNKIVSGSRKPELKLGETREDKDEDDEGEDEEGDENMASRVGGSGHAPDSQGKVGHDPENSAGRNIRVCSSILSSSNRTSENPPDMDAPDNPSYANHSCKGVVSEKCIGEFENSTHGVPARAAKCPTLYSLDLSDKCKEYISGSLIDPRNFSSARCSVNKMPYLDLPEDYITFSSGFGIGLFGNKDQKDFDMYDLRVQQTMPLLFSAAGMDRLICIAPDQVVPGSRKPQLKLEEDDEEEEEEENLASRAGGLEAATVLLGVSAIIFSLL